MSDELSAAYHDLLDGTYDCVDRIVLNAYDPLGASPGGFRTWWRRLHGGSDADLDTAHLMRLAGRFSRRVRAFAQAHGIPVVDCAPGDRKHELAEAHLREHPDARGLFLILVARAVAPVWEVERSASGTLRNLAKKSAYVNHYSFHIVDPEWGHLTIKMSGHPPFGAQVIVNGHEYVAAQGARQGVVFAKEGNCFTQVAGTAELARVADTLSEARIVGRLSQLCDRWIYTTCLCFGLGLAEQERSGFRYAYSVYQVEYSRNLLFKVGGQMEQVFQDLVDRNRARLDLPQIRTIFGTEHRHVRARPEQRASDQGASRVAVVLERPVHSLTVFKLHFGRLTLKGYTKGEHVLRFEAIVHNTKALGCGRVIAKFPAIVARLKGVLDRALDTFAWLDRAFISDDLLERLPVPSRVGNTRVGGVDIGAPRMRLVLEAVMALALAPHGFTAGELAHQVQAMGGPTMRDYDARRAAYDVKKLRGKDLIAKVAQSRRYQVLADGLRSITALVVLRERVLKPLLATVVHPPGNDPTRPKQGRKPKHWRALDDHYQTLRITMHALLNDLHVAHPSAICCR
jgi:hypothetical protein